MASIPVEGGGDLRVEAGGDVIEELHHGHLVRGLGLELRVRVRVRARVRARVRVRVGVGVRVRVRVRAAWLTPPAPLRGAALVPQRA